MSTTTPHSSRETGFGAPPIPNARFARFGQEGFFFARIENLLCCLKTLSFVILQSALISH